MLKSEMYLLSHWLDAIAFDFHGGLLDILHVYNVNEERKPFTFVQYVEFRKVEGYAVSQQREAISSILRDQGINHAIAQTHGGSLILSEEPFDFNPLIFKLTTGTDVGPGQEFDLNTFLSTIGVEEQYPDLYRGAI